MAAVHGAGRRRELQHIMGNDGTRKERAPVKSLMKPITASCAAALLACTLGACSNGGSRPDADASAPSHSAAGADTSAAAGTSEEAGQDREASRAEIEAAFSAARAKDYDNFSFATKTETAVTGNDEKGNKVTQVITTKMYGELDTSSDKPAAHIAYESSSNLRPEKTKYDLYLDGESFMVKQGDMLFTKSADADVLESYATSVMAITAEEETKALLDVAQSSKIETDDAGETSVTITADVAKILETNLVDASSLPEGSSIATLVANYVIDEQGYFKAARLMSSTSGAPTYRVTQTYKFSKHGQTELPEWPDMVQYVVDNAGIQTDEDGNMYVVDDEGNVFFIDTIEKDGTIKLKDPEPTIDYDALYAAQAQEAAAQAAAAQAAQGQQRQSSSGKSDSGTKKKSSGTDMGDPVFQEGDAAASAEGSSGDQGRAYITAYDGTIHYLDEPGSEIRDVGGSKVFIDADGEWYFLSTD